ncbi:MAG TPA: hypothetical protein PKC18_09455, partial [Lacipirellulaceae bacterium]|nr:hypothetical protein [Lacipirellulaceae bacterium]
MPFLQAVQAERVETLQREPQRIHPVVARAAKRVGPMQLQQLANGGRFAGQLGFGLFQRRNVGRRGRRRRAENILQQIQPPLGRRSAV